MNDSESKAPPDSSKGASTEAPVKPSPVSHKPTSPKQKGAKTDHSTNDLLAKVGKVGIYLFHDQRDQPYARIPSTNRRRIIPVRSEEFNKWLGMIAWKELVWAPGREALYSARRVLESQAIHDGSEHQLHLRVASHDNAIWVDLDGNKAVRIAPGSWEIVTDPPILFRSFPHQKPLPTPVKGGDCLRLLEHVNLRTYEDKRLFLAWLISSFVPGVSIPVLILCGPAHSGKSTILTIARRLIDPCIPEYQGTLSRQKDFSQVASQFRLLVFDNESKITNAQSDLLCGSVTGQGEAKRMLYTDEDTVVTEYQNVIGVSGVRLVVTQSDLMSRSILFELDQIHGADIRRDTEFWHHFETMYGEILGSMFDVLAAAMAVEKMVQLAWMSRLPDFTHWAAAISRTLGWNEQEFIEGYMRNVNRQHETVLESDPFAALIVKWIRQVKQWTGTVSDLLDQLERFAISIGIAVRSGAWPRTVQHLSGRLNYLEPCLEYAGIRIAHDRTASRRSVTITLGAECPAGKITKSCKDDAPVSVHDGEVPRSVTPEPASTVARDADDAHDAVFPSLSGKGGG